MPITLLTILAMLFFFRATEIMLRRIVFTASITGIIVGIFITLLHLVTVVPYILQAETYEQKGKIGPAVVSHSSHGQRHEHVDDIWKPIGEERTFYTFLTNTVAAMGFAIFLAIGYTMLGSVNWKKGLLWGLAGFTVFQLVPSMGLPPELPGMPSAELFTRQIWWVFTVICTALALGLLIYGKNKLVRVVGLVVLVIPHIIGGPQPVIHERLLPNDLVINFTMTSLVVGCLFWLLLGGISSIVFRNMQN